MIREQAAAKSLDTGGGSSGFTLVEVLVALAILSVAVVTAIQLFAGGLRLLKLAGDHQQAILIADEKARELGPLSEGRETGTDGAFVWERTITAAQLPVDVSGTRSTMRGLYAVTVRVSWGSGTRGIELATLRAAREHQAAASPPDQ